MKKICVAGNVAVDWFHFPLQSKDGGATPHLQHAPQAYAKPGGVLLLADFIKDALEKTNFPYKINAPRLPKDIKRIPNEEIFYGHSVISEMEGPGKEPLYRIGQYLGYTAPENGQPKAFPFNGKDNADMVVLDDVGTYFRDARDSWPPAFQAMEVATVIYKMDRPLCQGAIWDFIKEKSPRQLILVLNANDLRNTAGIHISRALSWERTAKDLVYQLQRSEAMEELQRCSFLIVLLGTDGAVLIRNSQQPWATLIFDPATVEGGFSSGIAGTVKGLSSLFTASITASLAQQGFSNIQESVKTGLARSRAFLEHGYVIRDHELDYPREMIFSEAIKGRDYVSCTIPASGHLQQPDPDFWRILDQKTRNTRLLVARDIVHYGQAAGLREVPAVRFGKLNPIDRREIEQLSAVRELLEEYLENPKPSHPLCFAVFGPPGSGKSFTVKQIYQCLPKSELVEITFNLSHFSDYQDLIKAFHHVRNNAFSGKIPFVFFDEFDAAFLEPLGWLKYFLAPMQDGVFMDGEHMHAIGKAVFVFAGGTKSSFQEFVKNPSGSPEQTPQPLTAEQRFRAAKGPDFVSRLRGYIDIMGPNRQYSGHEDDDAFIIRRAKLLRVLLELEPTAKKLFDPQKRLSMDEGVLRALLHVSQYRHGSRSMSALLEMSRLAGKKHFDISALPVQEQLDLHVDADEFLFLTVQERFHSLFRKADFYLDPEATPFRENEEAIVKAVAEGIQKAYERYCRVQDPAEMENCEDFIISNMDAAADLPLKLGMIRCGLRKFKDRMPNTPDITDQEVEELAKHEHRRWCRERKLQGWTRGEKNIKLKSNPYLIAYEDLPETVREFNLQMIYVLPVILKDLGYEVYRMEESELIKDPKLIDRLAQASHADYIVQRTKEGDTPEKNPAMMPWDQLHEDFKQANIGSAETIPRKLQQIGYEIHPIQIGENPPLLNLDKNEIDKIAEWEHTRWSWEKRFQGWIYREGDKDIKLKTSPYLLPWSQIENDIKERDREPARLIPQFLQQVGYKAVRRKDLLST